MSTVLEDIAYVRADLLEQRVIARADPLQNRILIRSGLLEELIIVWPNGNGGGQAPGSLGGFLAGQMPGGAFVSRPDPYANSLVVRCGLLEEKVADIPSLDAGEIRQRLQHFEETVTTDNRFERRMPLKQLFVLLLVLGALAIRFVLG